MFNHTVEAWIEETGQPITLQIEADHLLTEAEIYEMHPHIDICRIYQEYSKTWFNDQIVKMAHKLYNEQDLEHIPSRDRMYLIISELEYRCGEAVDLINERHDNMKE